MAAVTESAMAPPATAPLLSLLSDPHHSTLIKQGAEAKVYKTRLSILPPTLTLPSSSSSTLDVPPPLLLKYRFPKHYRHPHLSQSITVQRTVSEVRALTRCLKRGVHVPRVNLVDEKLGVIGLEWIEGRSVRELLGGGAEGDNGGDEEQEDLAQTDEDAVVFNDDEQLALMSLIGYQLAKMHSADVIHGDLTTSNMMVREARVRDAKTLQRESRGASANASGSRVDVLVDALDSMQLSDGTRSEVLLIDFGLSSTSPAAEDKAVDLYVLERAFNSTHPHSEHLFARVMQAYGENVDALWQRGQWRVGIGGGGSGVRTGKNQQKRGVGAEDTSSSASPWKEIKRKLDDVRLRGRKRSMVG